MSLSNIKNALTVESISDFRRFRMTDLTQGEYCSYFSDKAITQDQIVFDIECIKRVLLSKNSKNGNNVNGLSILCFQRQYPDHNDFFLFDIDHSFFESLSCKERSSLINRLIRCIDLTYVLLPEIIKVRSIRTILNVNQIVEMRSLIDWANLSETEFTYLQLLSTLGTSKEVGHIFGKSPRTIEKMAANLCKKLKIYNKLELQLFAKFLTSYIDIPYEYIRYPSSDSIISSNQYAFEGLNRVKQFSEAEAQ